MHGEGEARIGATPDIAEEQLAIARDPNTDRGFVLQAVTQRVGWCHVNVAKGADHAFVYVHGTSRSFQRATGRALDVARLADRRLNPELELLGHRDLDLRRLARGSKD